MDILIKTPAGDCKLRFDIGGLRLIKSLFERVNDLGIDDSFTQEDKYFILQVYAGITRYALVYQTGQNITVADAIGVYESITLRDTEYIMKSFNKVMGVDNNSSVEVDETKK